MIKAVLFDLDNTLSYTESLREIREAGRYEELTTEVLSKIKPYPKTAEIINKIKAYGVPVGLVTNSSRAYVNIILKHLNLPEFDVIVTYSDVGKGGAKPNAGSIELAVERLGLHCTQEILYIGDESIDIEASYRAGVKPVVPSWATRKPIAQIPAAVLSSDSLFKEFSTPNEIELIADRCGEAGSFNIAKKELLFAPLDLSANLVTLKGDIKILSLGRYFSQKSQLTAMMHENHKLSQEIFSKELKNNYQTPRYWAELLAHCLFSVPQYLGFEHFDIVTVIPAKVGKVKRLETMLQQVNQIVNNPKISFLNDLFYFTDDAVSMKTLSGAERAITAKNTLLFNERYSELIKGKRVLILDDVVTTGATFNAAFDLLTESAKFVFGISIAKTVSTSKEEKECSKCHRVMRVRRNAKTQEHFWSCTGYQDKKSPCNHTEDFVIKQCPRCGSDMKKRKNRKTEEFFLGCDGFFSDPKCNYAERLNWE